MSLAVRAGADSRRLEEACDLFQIEIEEQHAALSDARATAELFTCCVHHIGRDEVLACVRDGAPDFAWPRIPAARRPLPRTAVARRREDEGFLARLVTELPASSEVDGVWQEYFAILDRALEDRRLTAAEQEALRAAAVDSGLTGAEVARANRAYLESVIQVALADGVISEAERGDLEEVAGLLGLSDELDQQIEVAMEGRADRVGTASQPKTIRSNTIPLQGKTVCFTGTLNAIVDGQRASRRMATRQAEAHGMIVKKSVTKKLDYLVIADPDSMSGKAKKARAYGIRMLAEPVFWSAVEVQVE